MKPRVLIYRSHWLPFSEGFVSDHGRFLDLYDPIEVGLRSPANKGRFAPPAFWVCGKDRPSRLARYAFRAFGRAPHLEQLVRRSPPDLIHAHFATDALDMLPIAKRFDIPLIVTLHGYDVRLPLNRELRFRGDIQNLKWKKKRLFEQADQFLPVSEGLAQEALEAGYPAHKLRVHYLGTSTSAGQTPVRPQNQRRGVVYVGRLVDWKGLGDLIDAMAVLRERGTPHKLTVVGDGPERVSFEKRARDRKVDCDFLGLLPRSECLEWMSKGRVFCMPSREEPFGLVFLEAQLMGTPVVAYASGGALEAVQDAATGSLVDVGNIDGLATRLSKLLEDPQLWSAYSHRAHQHVVEHFDIAKQSRKLEAIYDQVRARRN